MTLAQYKKGTPSVQAGQDPLAISTAKQLGVTTYGATGIVYPEYNAQGNETGRLRTDGTFVRNQPTTTSTNVATFGQPILVSTTTVVQTNVGSVIDPRAIVTQNSNTRQ